MAYSSIKVKDLVESAVQHSRSVPEFQRGFVWKPIQVRELAESLYQRFPVGSLLLWNSAENVSPKGTIDGKSPNIWIVDGQQRTTALCLLLGRKPYWWNEGDWNEKLHKYDVRFDAFARDGEDPRFVIPNATMKKARSRRYLPLRLVLNLDFQKVEDQRKAQTIAKQLAEEDFPDGREAMDYYSELQLLCENIRGGEIVAIEIDNELEDVVKIFGLLNSKGTRVTEADIYLGVVASRPGNEGWVRDHFLKFLSDELDPAGFDVGPNTVFRTLTAVGAGRVRFKTIPGSFWDNANIIANWKNTTAAWKRLIKHLGERGISSLDIIPSNNVLVPMVALIHKFPDAAFDGFFYWFLQASIYGRYSAASDTRLEEDLKSIEFSKTPQECLQRLLKPLDMHLDEWEMSDYLADNSYSNVRLMLYLLVTKRKAKDWDATGWRIGFDNTKIARDFKPQWHHIFPRKYLEDKNVDSDLIDAIANIAVIGPKINIRISAKSPMEYITKYQITHEKLKAQFILDDVTGISIAEYEGWLRRRAQLLASATNEYLEELRKAL